MSTNISKQKRSDLISKIRLIKNHIAKAEQDKNTGNLLTYLSELEKEINGKKYGLVFEEHEEEIDQKLKNHTPVLIEEKDLFVGNGGQMNFLIEGDNLPALKLLEKTHKGKIDVIYIDPPYNTGNKDFIYNDQFVNSEDTYRHSKWLSFMHKKLCLAKELLSKKGVIFISIDDNEQAQLKLLCDEIFGEKNFIDNIVWDKKSSAKGVPPKNMIVNVHEYITAYQKSDGFKFVGQERTEESGKFKNPDNDPRGPWRESNIKSTIKPMDQAFTITNPNNGRQYTNTWAFSKKSLEKMIKENRILWKDTLPKQKEFMQEMKNENMAIRSNWGVFDAQSTTVFLKGLLPNTRFDNPKPIGLMKHLLKVTVKKEATILDFFAGSGTTGHAVMELNKEDGGNRKFILCTNNENNICKEITYERIKRVIVKENYQASLKYFKVGFVSIDEQLYYEYADQLLKHIRELVELENGINFEGNNKIKIILTDAELADFSKNTIELEKCQKLYLGHDVLVSGIQEKLFKDNEIEINIIPDYYYKELES